MKILELRFKNLNSLYGEWCIDFTNPEYIANGIFALTGPTGAGKSTILDAICLALYGATPRLGKITKNSNEIMSRQKGECYAEVLFESQQGRFRCNFSQHRSRKKAGGELQSPKHEIAEGAENGKVIEHQLRRVATVVEEKTGMDFERFTRSILLAQGGFDTFLKADVEQKSKILEQITGTEIYTDISRRAHERQRNEQDKLNLLQASVSGINILDQQQELDVQLDLEKNRKDEYEITAKVADTAEAIIWLIGISKLKEDINDLVKGSNKLKVELEQFMPKRLLLQKALRASELDSLYATLMAIREQQDKEQKQFENETGKLPELELVSIQQKGFLQKLEQQTLIAKEALKKATPLIQNTRLLDQQVVANKRAIASSVDDCNLVAQQITIEKKAKENELSQRDRAQVDLDANQSYLQNHKLDERLISELTGIEEQLKNLGLLQDELNSKKNDFTKTATLLNDTEQKLSKCRQQVSNCKDELTTVGKQLELTKVTLESLLGGCLLREYRNEKDTLLREMVFTQKIADLESERDKLEDGKPCPLCGANKHPFATGNIPVTDDIESRIKQLSGMIDRAESLEKNIQRIEKIENDARTALSDHEMLETTAQNDKNNVENRLNELSTEIKKALNTTVEQQNNINETLLVFDINLNNTNPESAISILRSKLSQWQENYKKQGEIERYIYDRNSELQRLDAVIETRNLALVEKQSELKSAKNEFADATSKRQEMFGNRNPDTEESRLNKAVTSAEYCEKEGRITYDESRQLFSNAKTSIATLKNNIDARVPELQQLKNNFVANCKALGFADEQQFLTARLSVVERDKLIAAAKILDDSQTELLARQTDREGRLAEEITKKITEATIETLEPLQKEYGESLKQITDRVAGLNHVLNENIRAKENIKEKQSFIEAQKKECGRWDKLHSLIGSADGKKYRNFAQGLTFELMVSHANRQLEKMTDRYLLLRDTEQPLELNVVDNYQAGEIRSTKNLSGGESFIVSLTLALGLAKMASRKVRVDSLFLDEGFGTLDDESLETALETLSSLHQDGKLIGVISHVSALKERIGTQINVIPISNGKSIIYGPGCRSTVHAI